MNSDLKMCSNFFVKNSYLSFVDSRQFRLHSVELFIQLIFLIINYYYYLIDLNLLRMVREWEGVVKERVNLICCVHIFLERG